MLYLDPETNIWNNKQFTEYGIMRAKSQGA